MANPIIRIKRGVGIPQQYFNGTGLTSGEFAYDTEKRILYLGVTGGYNPYDPPLLGGPTGSGSNVIPIGMQISNDPTLGGGAAVNARGGYSDYTVPTTKAVRDYVTAIQAQQALGVTLRPGSGIGITYAVNGETADVTITNLGTLRSYGRYNISGSKGGLDYLIPGSTAELIDLYGGGGVKLIAGKASGTDQLIFQNVGVTSIGGYTGDIKDIIPIVSLSGYTVGVGKAMQTLISKAYPISLTTDSNTGQIQISHESIPGVNGSYGGYISRKYYIPSVEVNSWGHITAIRQDELDLSNAVVAGLTEAVQDIIAYSVVPGSGISTKYNDSALGEFEISNTGLLSLGFYSEGTAIAGRLKGNGKLQAGAGISMGYVGIGAGLSAIKIENNAIAFTQIAFGIATDQGAGGIWTGGTLGKSTAQTALVPDSTNDTLRFYAGRGIGISAGSYSLGDDSILIWNDGINKLNFLTSAGATVQDNSTSLYAQGLSADLTFQASSNIAFSYDSAANKISIAASSGGAGGNISSIVGDYTDTNGTNLTSSYSGEGITGTIDVNGSDGILIRQTAATNQGDLFIGLSSRIIVPPQAFIGKDADKDSGTFDLPLDLPAVFKMPSTIETREYTDTWGGAAPADQNTAGLWNNVVYNPTFIDGLSNTNAPNTIPSSINRIIVDAIESGLTATVSYPTNMNWLDGDFTLYNTAINTHYVQPGKVLSLNAPGGRYVFNDPNPGTDLTPNRKAEIRLLGYPSAENIGSYLETISRPVFAQFSSCLNAGNPYGCKGLPPKLPSCVYVEDGVDPTDQNNWSYRDEYTLDSARKSTIKMDGNVILRDSLVVAGDIWLKGNILDAETGCIFKGFTGSDASAGGGGGGGSITCVNCKTDGGGIESAVIPDRNLYVHGGTAAFNVSDFSTTDSVISIGGLSGGIPLNSTTDISDRGIVFFNNAVSASNPLNNVTWPNAATPTTTKASFVGIDQDTGRFTYIPNATKNISSGVETYTGNAGSAYFSDINGVRIYRNDETLNGGALIDVGSLSAKTTQIKLIGNTIISSSATATNFNTIDFKGSSGQILTLGSGATGVNFGRSINFDTIGVFNNTTPGAAASGNLLIKYWKTSGNNAGKVAFRGIAADAWIEAVDTGKYTSGGDGVQNSAWTTDAPQQTLYNKTLADGVIIDCGTY